MLIIEAATISNLDNKTSSHTRTMSKHATLGGGASSRQWTALRRVTAAGFFLCAALIAHESLVPSNGAQSIDHMDKVIHLMAYGLLAFLAGLSFSRTPRLYVALACIGYGLVIEVLQGSMGLGRTASLADAIANSVGVLLAMGALRVLYRKKHVNHNYSDTLE